MKRALLLTDYPLVPLHTRTEAVRRCLERLGFAVTLRRRRPSRLDRLTLGAFAVAEPLRLALQRRQFDLLMIQGSPLIGAVAVGRLSSEITIFETLDHWPSYFCAGAGRRWAARISGLDSIMGAAERAVAGRAADAVVVNSPALQRYFAGRAFLIPYSSPLEGLVETPGRRGRPLGLLYLGVFSRDKGALEMLALAERLDLPLWIYGEVLEPEVRGALRRRGDAVSIRPRLASGALRAELALLLADRALVGVSLIRAVHHSYASQEANKEIDYLALGLPLIGNHRRPTAEKVQAGAGVFVDDPTLLTRLVADEAVYDQLAGRAARLYRERFSAARFEAAFGRLIGGLAGDVL